MPRPTWSHSYEIWLMYVYNERCRLEKDISQLQERIRYRQPSAVDCLELIIALERLNGFNDFCRDTNYIFKSVRTANNLNDDKKEE